MSRKANYILVFSLLAAGAAATAVALMLRSSPAGARTQPQAPQIKLGKPGYGGTGCPRGTATAILSPDQRKLTILFDQYVAQTRRGQQFARKSCNLAVPLEVPAGLSVSLLRLDYRGFAKIPKGGRGTFAVEYFFAGIKGPRLEQEFPADRNFPSAYEDDYLIRDTVAAPIFSPCGEDATARVNSSVLVKKESAFAPDEAMMTVDSTDITAEGIIFYLDIKRC